MLRSRKNKNTLNGTYTKLVAAMVSNPFELVNATDILTTPSEQARMTKVNHLSCSTFCKVQSKKI